MIRTRLVICIWLVLLGLLAISCAPAGPVVKIELPTAAVSVNQTFRVPVKVEQIANLTAAEMHLSFNPAVLEVVELVDGDFLKADFTVQKVFDNTTGTLDYAVAQINRPSAAGSGTLLEIVFRAKAGGAAPLRFRSQPAAPAGVLFSDANGKSIPVALLDGVVNVGGQ